MAAEKPIVSTPVVDVLESYSHVVHVGRHSQAFVGACERALEEGAVARERRAGMMRNVVMATSWDSTVARMRALIEEVARGQHRKRAQIHAPAAAVAGQARGGDRRGPDRAIYRLAPGRALPVARAASRDRRLLPFAELSWLHLRSRRSAAGQQRRVRARDAGHVVGRQSCSGPATPMARAPPIHCRAACRRSWMDSSRSCAVK